MPEAVVRGLETESPVAERPEFAHDVLPGFLDLEVVPVHLGQGVFGHAVHVINDEAILEYIRTQDVTEEDGDFRVDDE